MKHPILKAFGLLSILGLAACQDDASVASYNLSKAADMFEIDRKIVFYNGITDAYVAVIEGRCSIEPKDARLEVTCKIGPNEFEKHFLGISDNVTYFAMQTTTADVSVYHSRIIWKPQSIIVDIDLRGDANEVAKDRH